MVTEPGSLQQSGTGSIVNSSINSCGGLGFQFVGVWDFLPFQLVLIFFFKKKNLSGYTKNEILTKVRTLGKWKRTVT